MIFLIRKNKVQRALFCCAGFLCAACLFHSLAEQVRVSVFSPHERTPVTVVIDPGHGGEDGGAVSPGGVAESHINLTISMQLRDLLCFAGQQTVMTRDADAMICNEGLKTIRERKASDIRNRVSIVERTENAVLLSIHQNSLPSSTVTHGAQAFWNRQEGAEALAGFIQDALNTAVNTGNEKHTKQIPSTIYLMNHVTVPAVLVECGFLSNPQETKCLQTETYQRGLSVAIAAGFLRGISEGEFS